jgi:hypothetical protein
MKKRKLNSKNPKYSDKSKLNKEPFMFKQSYATIRTSDGRSTGQKAIVKAVWY